MQNNNIVIGIEGMVASGKTSICKELTNIIENSIFIDGGLIYRGIVLAIFRSGIDIKEMLNTASTSEFNTLDLMKKLQVEFRIENNQTIVYIAGKKVEEKDIQTEKNSIEVSNIAGKVNNKPLFLFARGIIDTYREKYNIIVSGRELVDLYPDMTCHIYITASLEERVKRRYNQYEGKLTLEEIKNNIIERDKMHEDAGFNKKCEKTLEIDVTECKNVKESAQKILNKMITNNIISNEILK